MTLAVQRAAPSTLADLIGQVIDAFDAMGNATPIMVGKAYLEQFGVGSGPRVLFVPDQRGKIGPPYEMGNTGSVSHACEIYVRGDEVGTDVDRFRNAYALGDLVIDCVQTAGTGKVEWGDYADDSPVDVDAFGADLALSFSYRRDIRHSHKRWALPAATEDTSAAAPGVPPGQPGTVDSVDATVAPKEA